MLLTALIVAAFWAAKAVLVPASFGQYGWYRGNALKEVAAATKISFAGHETCEECHTDIAKRKAGNKHAGLSCEACHGANAAHAEDPNTPTVKITDALFCLRCHAKNYTRPEKFPQVDAKEHAGKDACRTCHDQHAPTEAPSK